MRKEDHQFFQPMYISSFGTWTPARSSTRRAPAGAGRRRRLKANDTILPTTCKMERP